LCIGGRAVLLHQLLRVITTRTARNFSQDFEVVAYRFYEFLTATLHEPDFKSYLSRQTIIEWSAFSSPIICPEDRLLEVFMVSQRERKVKGFKLRLSFRVYKY